MLRDLGISTSRNRCCRSRTLCWLAFRIWKASSHQTVQQIHLRWNLLQRPLLRTLKCGMLQFAAPMLPSWLQVLWKRTVVLSMEGHLLISIWILHIINNVNKTFINIEFLHVHFVNAYFLLVPDTT
ncbi:unnamed protein product [Larinioides sclopetarius]|uniref:Uncharacterized protein n=1 Tax=Larinioides sclopetarius TaxID=280406 RepID=A0AAV2AYK5_9ARAC